MMDIRTSTPSVPPKIKISKPNKRSTNNKSVHNDWYNALNAPENFDFNHEISDINESFFDDKSDEPKQFGIFPHGPLVSWMPTETDSIVNCLKNCSISGINALSNENSTLKVATSSADNTLTNDPIVNIATPNNTEFEDGSIERRKSTVVKPFSFELREKLKSEHKLERLRYYQNLITEESKAGGLKKKPTLKPIALPKLHQVTKKVMKVGQLNTDVAQKIEIQPWKKKPFQVKLQKLPPTIPKSPKLSTAERARARKLYQERMMEKEYLEIERRKKILATQKQREKLEIAACRKQTVHKALPMPRYNNNPSAIPKRPACDPPFPTITKRRRRI